MTSNFVYLISSRWAGMRGHCDKDELPLAGLTSVLSTRWSLSTCHSLPCTAPGVRDLGVNTTVPSSSVDSSFVLVGMINLKFFHSPALLPYHPMRLFRPVSRLSTLFVLCWHAPGLFLSVSLRGTLRLTLTYILASTPPSAVCSIPCQRMVPDTGDGIHTHGRHFNDAYGRVCNLSIPFASSQLNQVRRADTRFLPDVGRRHVRPANSHILRGRNLIPRHSHLNECIREPSQWFITTVAHQCTNPRSTLLSSCDARGNEHELD